MARSLRQLKPARDAKGEQWLVLHLQEAADVGYKVATGQAAMLRPFGLNLLQRLIIRPLDDTLSPGPLQHAEWVDAQVRISLLEAHARIAVEPEGGAGGGGFEHSKQSFAIVKQLQQPHLRTLLQQWVALLRDHAVLHNVPPDIVSRYTPALVSSRAATAVEPVRGHYEAAWACVLDAATCCASVPPAHGAAADPTDVCLTPDDYNLLLAVSQLAVLRTIFAGGPGRSRTTRGGRLPQVGRCTSGEVAPQPWLVGRSSGISESPGPGGSGQLFALEASPIAKGSGRGKGTWRSELRVMQALVRLTAPGYHATGYLEPGSAVEVLALLTEVVQSTNQPPLAASCAAVLHNLVGPPVSGAAVNKAALVQDRQVLEAAVRLGCACVCAAVPAREQSAAPGTCRADFAASAGSALEALASLLAGMPAAQLPQVVAPLLVLAVRVMEMADECPELLQRAALFVEATTQRPKKGVTICFTMMACSPSSPWKWPLSPPKKGDTTCFTMMVRSPGGAAAEGGAVAMGSGGMAGMEQHDPDWTGCLQVAGAALAAVSSLAAAGLGMREGHCAALEAHLTALHSLAAGCLSILHDHSTSPHPPHSILPASDAAPQDTFEAAAHATLNQALETLASPAGKGGDMAAMCVARSLRIVLHAGASSPAEGPSGQRRWANQCVALVLPHTILYSQGLLSSAPASGLEPEDVKTTGKVLKLVLLAVTLAKDDRGAELASLQVLLMMVISIAKHTGAAAQLSTTAAHMLTRLASTHSEVFKAAVQTLPPAAKQYLQVILRASAATTTATPAGTSRAGVPSRSARGGMLAPPPIGSKAPSITLKMNFGAFK
ncbi:hypothetical protein CYMTET_10532 [Cymbomonas tetramitiformis]|uniref:LAA1-like C-terminal TPR repeats domain-containing protein n=1 Tax=Cymbomonas tetramitiformis TaxID=36881 RepID=A0AAE0LED4_9CHLO|nr:hypothetical protein CYMTET_10532 [Cymbomonas tetramitiformis]